MVSMLQISNTDPTLVGYISRTLLLESSYLRQAQRFSRAELREEQALSLARAYGFSLSEEDISPEALESFSLSLFLKILRVVPNRANERDVVISLWM